VPKKSFPPRDAPRRDAGRSIAESPVPPRASADAPTDTDTPPLGIGLSSPADAPPTRTGARHRASNDPGTSAMPPAAGGQQPSTDAEVAGPPSAGRPPGTDDGPTSPWTDPQWLAGAAAPPPAGPPAPTFEPRALDPREADPRALDPRALDPRALEPRAAELRAAELRAAEPRAAEPRAAEPRAAEPRALDRRAVEPRAPEPPTQLPPTNPEPPDPTPSDPPQADPPTVEQPVVPPSQPPAWAVAPDRPAQIVRPAPPADPEPAPATTEQVVEPQSPGRRRGLRPPGPGRRPTPPDRQTQQRLDQVARVRRALTGPHQVAVVSLKGGVGRTTVSALLALTLAEHREDRVIVVDSTPAGGTLSDRLTGATGPGIRDLLDRLDVDDVHSLADIELFSGAVGNLRVLASDQDLSRNLALNGLEYERVCLLLQRHFPIIVTDGATGPALPATLSLAHGVVVVGSFTVDGAVRAGKTLDWLVAHGYRDLAGRAVLALDGDRASDDVDAVRLREHFAARFRAVVEIPHDRHLAQGGRIDANALAGGTRDAVLELAALVADEFGTVTAGRR
jgi:MinD-like ATPase involved in chromosome partitioning or flagellar assembly